jgi:hypothetical protein
LAAGHSNNVRTWFHLARVAGKLCRYTSSDQRESYRRAPLLQRCFSDLGPAFLSER